MTNNNNNNNKEEDTISCPFDDGNIYPEKQQYNDEDGLVSHLIVFHDLSSEIAEWISKQSRVEKIISDRIKELESMDRRKDYDDEYIHKIEELQEILSKIKELESK